ncbi:MAG TPA: ATPase, partial [Candidatus Binatia bacterium]|nr:ATPase [Candidatus Binatia bacterium]
MAIGELLLAKNLITEQQLKKVLHQQKIAGGRFGDNIVALGYITREKLETLLSEPPPVPMTVAESGLDLNFLLTCLLRLMY